MNALIFGMLAETPIHPGSGQDAGFVDLPVAREAATDYPVVVGSSVKGALLERARAEQMAERETIFGKEDQAGHLLVGDARLLLLPVRSLQGAYRWVTCPHLLERFERDRARANAGNSPTSVPSFESGTYLGLGDTLYLEERQFQQKSDIPAGVVEALKSLVLHGKTADRLTEQLVIVNDDDFAWFARYCLAVAARNVLDETKKTSKNLWYEETIPPDALFYCLLAERGQGALKGVAELFSTKPYLRVGGNETVGQGWFALKKLGGGEA